MRWPTRGRPRARWAALGAPRLDFYRFWDVHFPTSILGSIFNGFWLHLWSIFMIFQWFVHPFFEHDFWLICLTFRQRWFCENLISSKDSLQKTRNRRLQNCMNFHWLSIHFCIIVASNFHDFSWFSVSILGSIFGCIFNGNWLQNDLQNQGILW